MGKLSGLVGSRFSWFLGASMKAFIYRSDSVMIESGVFRFWFFRFFVCVEFVQRNGYLRFGIDDKRGSFVGFCDEFEEKVYFSEMVAL